MFPLLLVCIVIIVELVNLVYYTVQHISTDRH